MQYRNNSPKLIQLNLEFRELWNKTLGSYDQHNLGKCLEHKNEMITVINNLKDIETSEQDHTYFTSLGYLVNSLLLGIEGFKNVLAGADSSQLFKGSLFNAEEFLRLSQNLDAERPSVKEMRKILHEWHQKDDIKAMSVAIQKLNHLALPVFLSIATRPYAHLGTRESENLQDPQDSETQKPHVISIRFYIDSELWANPQLIKPNHQYAISGTIKLNKWPAGYDKLELRHASSTDDTYMILSFPAIEVTDKTEIPVTASIVLKYAQSLLDPPHAIRLIARFTAKGKESIHPRIIGYDQLILRVADPDSFPFPTGYNKLNEKAFEIYHKVRSDLPELQDDEVLHFSELLSAIMNYQGYCFLHSKYKGISNLPEYQFRDNLIEYLSPNPRMASTIIKEGTIAGGRVEIRFHNIVAELKVETSVQDREKIIASYHRQPVVYSSATSAQLSILCVLDLTEKKLPSAIAAKNVFLVDPPLHGFEGKPSSTRVAVVFIDGNTLNPSSY